MKLRHLLVLILVVALVAACTPKGQDVDIAVAVILTQTAAAPAATVTPAAPPAAVVAPATISGRAHLMAPPTPPLAIYAVDQETGQWAMVETAATDGEASFTLSVPPGSYVVFAFPTDPKYTAALGYATSDGAALAHVKVSSGQTIGDIRVSPPGPSECGTRLGFPASPDGRFAAVKPSEACLAAQAAAGTYVPVSQSVCQTIQEQATGAIALNFTMEPSAPFTDFSTQETGMGCTLTATGTGATFPDPTKVVSALLGAFAGWSEQTRYQAGGPTGMATGLTRDSALMLVSVGWEPAPGLKCPSDQPIGMCDLKPEQKIYTARIQIAQK